MIGLAISESGGSTSDPVLTFSGNINSLSSLALLFHTNSNIDLESFTYVDIDEGIVLEVSESKFETEVEEKLSANKFWLREKE